MGKSCLAAFVVAPLAVVGCSGGGRSGSAAGTTRELLPADQRTIFEPDLTVLAGSTLFVHNATRGLSAIDVKDPDKPTLAAQVPSLAAKGGELYVRDGDTVLVTLTSEVAAVVSAARTPSVVSRLAFPGKRLTSRLIGNRLVVVSTETDRTWVTTFQTADPTRVVQLDQKQLAGETRDVHVTDATLYLAQRVAGNTDRNTRLRLVDISGVLAELGSIDLRGFPRGRFHMEESGTTFRIVTHTNRNVGSHLFVLDVTDRMKPAVLGSIEGLAPNEDLHATRFVGDRAYVVTYEPLVIEVSWGGFDPLWVISLQDPRSPRVLGSLKVPGWSDFIFPRGPDRLVAVGRGDQGGRVAASLYDVTDPAKPAELRRVEFGVSEASSEANTDFRAVTIVEAGALGATPFLAIPYTNNLRLQDRWVAEHHVQLIDLLPGDLELRGEVPQVGLVRRTLPIGTKLYSVSDKTVAAVDVANRDGPVATATVTVGDTSAPETATPVFLERPVIRARPLRGGCTVGGGEPATTAPFALLAVVLLLSKVRRSRTA